MEIYLSEEEVGRFEITGWASELASWAGEIVRQAEALFSVE